ncbi:MAG: hypothetical protein K1X89_08375 [Myxococcaceae bacterium]|nr:hypothetical protein [Myxococcaceae bacterium]
MATTVHRTPRTAAAHRTRAAATTKAKPAAKAKAKPAAKPRARRTTTRRPVQTEAAAAVKHAAKAPVDPKTPPSLTGTLALVNGVPVLTSKAGTFEIVNPSGVEDSLHALGGTDVQAFTGKVVTVRGWPVQGWQPGQPGQSKLAVEEFAPGKSSDFVSGRISLSGTDVTIRVRADKLVKVTDKALAAALGRFDKLGVVLPGAVTKKGDAWSYAGRPDDFYILAGQGYAYGAQPTAGPPGGTRTLTLQLAHGQSAQCAMPESSFAATAMGQRHYLYGHFEGDLFVAKGFTPSAGAWTYNGYDPSDVGNAAFRSAAAKAGAPDGDAPFGL